MDNFASVKQYYTYPQYITFIEELVANHTTSGHNKTEERIGFTRLNLQRMQRWDKTVQLTDTIVQKALAALPQVWWIITEVWCGDSAQNIPVLHKIAEASKGNIELRMILRDDNPEIMDQYLTNGGRSIPKLVAVDQLGHELFTWGPRPTPGQQIIMHWKANQDTISHDDAEKDLHLWYARDKGRVLMEEIGNRIA